MEEKQSFLKQKIDLESPNKNIVPITTSIGGDGKLSVGGCSIEELVKKYDSPLYILDEITLRKSCRAYKKALEKYYPCLLYTSPSPRDRPKSRMPSSA